MTIHQAVLQSALQFHNRGMNVIPVKANTKEPAVRWKRWITTRQTKQNVEELFARPHDGGECNIAVLCGRVSENLVVLDFDNRAVFEDLFYAHMVFQKILRRTLVVDTRRGVHVYFRATQELCDGIFCCESSIEVRATGRTVLVPPSRIDDHIYRFRNSSNSIYTIDSINALGLPPELFKKRQSRNVIELTDHQKELLSGKINGYPSRSEAEQSVIVGMLKDGFSTEEITNAFEIFAGPLTKYREKGRLRYSWLEQSIRKGKKYLGDNRRPIDIEINRLESLVSRIYFTPRTAAQDRRVSRSVLRIARQAGTLKGLHLSVRRVAEIAEISKSSASESLIRLPFLKRVEQHTMRTAAAYDVVTEWFDAKLHEGNPGVASRSKLPRDVFCRGGIGQTSGEVYLVFTARVGQWLTVEEVSEHANLAVPSIRRALSSLVEHGVIRKDTCKRPYSYCMNRIPDELFWQKIAFLCGTEGQARLAKIHHQDEREAYSEIMVARRASKENILS
ncbi:bifunctional DNA primase/polymerase [Alkalispirochaeta alkalica]|uniref:bifunctional DNA primase/polymerase n=1 Tax=Alkalispirochaeta alkalica TaxID=46356 RepID=UPI00039C9C14|nr:bifunctional DNA primase/polymerase [Alkalispirochaeta alkalica]